MSSSLGEAAPLAGAALRSRLLAAFAWRGDRTDASLLADVTGWWRDAALLTALGPALAELTGSEQPTVVLGLPTRGSLLGGLVATTLGVGFVEVRRDQEPLADSDAWVSRTSPPDYRDRHLRLALRRDLIHPGDRVLLVDDWIDTGGQATAAHGLVEDAGGTWLGAAVLVDALTDRALRRRLQVRSLFHVRDLQS